MTEPAAEPVRPEPAQEPETAERTDQSAPETETETFSREYVEKLRREAAGYRTKLRELEPKAAKAEELEAANATENEKAVASARAEAEKTTAEKYARLLVQAEARAVASELRFRDPGDAVRLVDLEEVAAETDGSVDREAVRAALRKVAEAKPYLTEAVAAPTPEEVGIGTSAAGGKEYGTYSVADFDRELFGTKNSK